MIFDIIYLVLLFFATFFIMLYINLWFENRGKIFLKKKLKVIPPISLVIPAYNEDEIIEKTLRKIKDIDYPRKKLEIIVVDDGSTDRTYDIVKKAITKFRLKGVKLFTKKNGGKASALNFGIKKAKNDFIAVVDADTFLNKNALKECMKHFDTDEVAAVTSHILCSRKKSFLERMQNIELMIISVTRKLQEYANVVWATPGPLSVYRKAVLKKLGGFDEKILVEDVEIAWRILGNGYKIKMALDAFAYSLFPNSFSRWWKQRLRWAIGGLQTFLKYKSTIGNKHHIVGSFLVPTSFISFSTSIIGIGFFLYLFIARAFNFLTYAVRALSFGLDPFFGLESAYYIDFKIIIGLILFFASLALVKISFSLHKWRGKWYDIPIFLFIYPILYSFVNLHAIYKYYKGETGWLTK